MKHEIRAGKKERTRKGTLRVFSFSFSLLSPKKKIHNAFLWMRMPTKNFQCFTDPVSILYHTSLRPMRKNRTGMLSLLTTTTVVKTKST